MLIIWFEFPANLKTKKFISLLGQQYSVQLLNQHYGLKTFYDSFDWRLYNANLMCEFDRSKQSAQLILKNADDEQSLTSVQIADVPAFPAQLPDSALKTRLQTLLEMRALLALLTLELQVYQLTILVDAQQFGANLTLEEYGSVKSRLKVEILPQQQELDKSLQQFLTETLGLKKVTKPLLIPALKAQGRKPKDYSSKLNLSLQPALPADQAMLEIYRHLLSTMKINEQGTINNIDSEFLHDFRVAVRRTRTALTQTKCILPAKIEVPYRKFFAWLGKITTTMRDLDVYLLNFPEYQSCLPEQQRQHLLPLQEFLIHKQMRVQKKLAKHLVSKKYLTSVNAWEQYLKRATKQKSTSKTMSSIKQLADQRIWEIYQRALTQGDAINAQSLNTELHELRKTCKKLRYLMEFFQSLYVSADIKILIKGLKEFQDLLGEIQDCTIEEKNLQHYIKQMQKRGTPAQTLTAMQTLTTHLNHKRSQARQNFAQHYAAFKLPEHQAKFACLFANKKPVLADTK